MASKLQQHLTYNVNRAVEAQATGDPAALLRYADRIAEARNQGPLFAGYSSYVSALCAPELATRIDHLRAAIVAFTSAGSTRGAAAAMLELGRRLPDAGDALVASREALTLFTAAGDAIGRSKALSNIAVHHMDMQEFGEALRAFQDCIEIQSRSGDVVGLGISALNMSGCFHMLGDHSRALQQARRSIELFEGEAGATTSFIWQTGGWKAVPSAATGHRAHAYINYANALDVLGEHEKSIEALGRARELMKASGNTSGEAMVLNQIGQSFLEMSDASQAETCFRESVRLFEATGTTGYLYATALQSLGEACVSSRRFSDAGGLYERALVEFRAAGHKAGEAETLLYMGEAAVERHDSPHAVPVLEEGLKIGQAIAATEIVVRCNRALGSALMSTDSSRAREYLGRALLIAEEKSMRLEQVRIHRELASYYKLVGDSTAALSHFERYHALQQEIFTERSERQLKSLQILHDVEQYQASIATMAERVRQIEEELEEKTHELAMIAERIMERHEFVRSLERGLARLISATPERKDEHARELLSAIRNSDRLKSEWDEVTRKFLSIHREFAERLMKAAPDISPAEFKVAVLARLSMDAKQIADVLKLSQKTVFNHQGRIRKKLGMPREAHLQSFLIRFEAGPEDNGASDRQNDSPTD